MHAPVYKKFPSLYMLYEQTSVFGGKLSKQVTFVTNSFTM